MPCCWCNGDHGRKACPEKLTIDEALDELGPIRAKRARPQNVGDPQLYWLDGRIVGSTEVKQEAIKRRRQKNAN